jgi:hypothetical protein
MITCAGGRVVGPFAATVEALENLDYSNAIDAAVLDVGLGTEVSYPLADALQITRIPYVFVTGFERRDMPERFRGATHLKKPFTSTLLIHAILNSMGRPQPKLSS